MAISLELAISAIRAGRREEGRQLLNLLIQQNPNDDKAWLWMSSVVDTDEQRARCLYHVLAINPGSDLARRGLQVLGIVVSDSRPVKVPRDSQPIQIPKPTEVSQQGAQTASSGPRRPFLIDPKTITQELPFTPLKAPFAEPIQASPGILEIDVEAVLEQEKGAAATASPVASTKTQKMVSGWPAVSSPGQTEIVKETEQNQATGAAKTPTTDTQEMNSPLPRQGGQPHQPADLSRPQPASFPQETRPSQPVPVTYPNMNMGLAPGGQSPYYPMLSPGPYPNHANVTMGMPPAPYDQPQPPAQFMLPGYANPTLGMPLPVGQPQLPLEPPPGIHSNSTIGMTPYEQQQLSQMLGFHSSATMMMPPMSEAEARARLMAGQAIPTANATAMALQNSATGRGVSHHHGFYSARPEEPEDEEEGEEFNILAVIIFGTLSVTALGGFGMLILLVFTSPLS